MLTVCVFVSYLDELSVAGECAAEYLGLYQKLIKPAHWKVYLAARGVLPYIGNLITKVLAPPASHDSLDLTFTIFSSLWKSGMYSLFGIE